MQDNLPQLAALCCTFAAVLCTALAIRRARKQTRVDHRICDLERLLRERLPKRDDAAADTRIFG